MWNKILTIPFFIGMFTLPLGIIFLLMGIPLVETWILSYGNWAFAQWDRDDDHE